MAEKISPLPAEEFCNEWSKIRQRRIVAFGAPTGEIQSEIEQPIPADQPQGQQETSPAPPDQKRPKNLVGLALSGGGLRSALFNDGFLQALSHRGLLRYVDYLCSVSGGGYIAGHLMTKTRGKSSDQEASNPETNFHECAADWQFGRDVSSGKEDPGRLPGIGGYLNRKAEFFAGYFLRQIPVFMMYFSAVGIFATLLAIYYRSFDDPMFRLLFTEGLGVRFGNELFIAFLPALMIAVFGVVVISLVWISEVLLWKHHAGYPVISILRCIARATLWATAVASLASVAVFIGNDLTKVTGDSSVSNTTSLNSFAIQITIIAGFIQVLVFLGRDRLFSSEKSEAARWKKTSQAIISNGVVAFIFFAFVHVMAAENISQYTSYRDPYLVRGDVTNWQVVSELENVISNAIAKSESSGSKNGTDATQNEPETTSAGAASLANENRQKQSGISETDFREWAKKNIIGSSSSRAHWHYGLAVQGASVPETPAELSDEREKLPLNRLKRFWFVTKLCVLPARWTYRNVGVPQSERDRAIAFKNKSFNDVVVAAHFYEKNRDEVIQKLNGLLGRKTTTQALVKILTGVDLDDSGVDPHLVSNEQTPAEDRTSKRVGPKGNQLSLYAKLLANPQLKARLDGLHAGRQKSIQVLLNEHDLGTLPHAADGQTVPGLHDRILLNRYLIKLFGNENEIFNQPAIASTHVVQPHDQRLRWNLLTIWVAVLAISLWLTKRLNSTSFLFHFYHDSISRSFLRGTKQSISGDSNLHELQPWTRGLPYPVYLAAWMQPSTMAGVGRIARALAMTPDQVTLRSSGVSIARTQSDAPLIDRRWPLTLADAVSTSGAAVAPNMTDNFALSLMMDFFGARLGMWFGNPSKEHDKTAHIRGGIIYLLVTLVFVSLALSTLAAYASLVLIPNNFLNVFYALGLARTWLALLLAVICYSVFSKQGYPSIVKSFLLLPFQRKSLDQSQSSIEHLDNIFVSDGGFYDYLGVTELLHRRCELIIVSEAGINSGTSSLETLAVMCERASSELGVRFIDLDHESPIEFARLKRDTEERVPQPFMAMRIKYPDPAPGEPTDVPREGILFYAQMAISENDPIEIQQIKNRFPSFPDEPTSNQFYTPEQVAAYRDLGYHIGNRLCNHLQRWSVDDLKKALPQTDCSDSGDIQPLYDDIVDRLTRSYLQACYEEYFFKDNDVYGESIWRARQGRQPSIYPSFNQAANELKQLLASESRKGGEWDENHGSLCAKFWLDKFMTNADVFSCYLQAVNADINCLSGIGPLHAKDWLFPSETRGLFEEMFGTEYQEWVSDFCDKPHIERAKGYALAAHYTVLAAASQQLHRGTPHAIFQVGGRDKLCCLLGHLVGDLFDVNSSDEENLEDDSLDNAEQYSDRIVHEVYEMTESIFQSADRLAAISFIQVFCKEVQPLIGCSCASTSQKSEQTSFLLSLDFRQLMLESMMSGYRSRVKRLTSSYLRFLANPCEANDVFNTSDQVALVRDLDARGGPVSKERR